MRDKSKIDFEILRVYDTVMILAERQNDVDFIEGFLDSIIINIEIAKSYMKYENISFEAAIEKLDELPD